MIGQTVINDDGDEIGFVGGCYIPEVYIGTLVDKWNISPEAANKSLATWDNKYPGWREELVPIVVFREPVQSMSRQEVATHFDMPLEHVTDKLYEKSSTKQRMMVMPLKAVKLKPRAQQ